MPWSSRIQFMLAAGVTAGALLAGAAVFRPQVEPDIPSHANPAPKSAPSPEASKRPLPDFFVMIDASHGGDDAGARLGPTKVPEKEVSLILARQLKHQLEERGIAARLLRDGDVSLSLDQRAAITNEERAGLYIALHAGQPGNGFRVYAPALLMAQRNSTGRFLPWENAQTGSLAQSRVIAGLVANELRKSGITTATLAAPLRPLNNVVAPAIAVELSPGTTDPRSPQFQRIENALISGIVAGVLAVRDQEGKGPRL
jgi:N-acetylmuramoyl-L-alanine amidase